MKHRAIVYHDGTTLHTDTFDYLCDAVQFCNSHAKVGAKCKVTEVIETLTGEIKLSTITSWVYKKEVDSEVHSGKEGHQRE